MHKAALLAALEEQERASLAYWSAFDDDTFFRRIGESWSPAETVRHLVKSLRPVAKALGMSKLVLRLLFGRPRRAPESFDELVTRYRGLLAAGGEAGRFAPSPRHEPDLAAFRQTILRDYAGANRSLRAALATWPDEKLDRLQLPHPLLGKLSVREMLYFTLYHLRHHMDVVERHRREQAIP
ncbi:MAG TPA: DinB family protein [Thermoanaerobaculia bacterium]|nr:DinB family protein [Thermoanaerobaculia bacterium]